jgi:hypothetical protein
MHAARDELGGREHGGGARSARGLDVHRGQAAQFFIYLDEKSAEVKLAGEQAAREIAHHSRLHIAGINARVGQRRATGLDGEVPQGATFLLQIASEVSAAGANEMNRDSHSDRPF